MGSKVSDQSKVTGCLSRFIGGQAKQAAKVPQTAGDVDEDQQAGAEIRPPWVEYPGIPHDDFFWREAGDPWRSLVWEPYYNSLSQAEQEQYVARWKLPAEWQTSYFNKDRQEFWDHVDDPE